MFPWTRDLDCAATVHTHRLVCDLRNGWHCQAVILKRTQGSWMNWYWSQLKYDRQMQPFRFGYGLDCTLLKWYSWPNTIWGPSEKHIYYMYIYAHTEFFFFWWMHVLSVPFKSTKPSSFPPWFTFDYYACISGCSHYAYGLIFPCFESFIYTLVIKTLPFE